MAKLYWRKHLPGLGIAVSIDWWDLAGMGDYWRLSDFLINGDAIVIC